MQPETAYSHAPEGNPLPRSQRRHAFTLIEILVVVAMIAILIAILLPSLARARDQARSLSCRANMKNLMTGMFGYVSDHRVLPGTHALFWMQALFGKEWPRPAGVTWDGARDKQVGMSYTPAYNQPYYADPEFVADVPRKGTLWRYTRSEGIYTCPSERPGPADGSPMGGGNGRLGYSMNGYIGYRLPDSLQSFTYVADSLDNLLPDHRRRVSFRAGQRVGFSPSSYMAMFEDHPSFHTNSTYPDGSFNCIDRIATRHMFSPTANGGAGEGRSSIAFLDGHVEARLYPGDTLGRELFTEFGQPHMWRESGAPDQVNMAAFIKRLPGPCPWANDLPARGAR